MNKLDLIMQVADDTDLPKAKAGAVVDAVFGAICEALRRNEDVRLLGFGTFVPTARGATIGRNPRTGDTITIPATNSVKFKPGKGLRDKLQSLGG